MAKNCLEITLFIVLFLECHTKARGIDQTYSLEDLKRYEYSEIDIKDLNKKFSEFMSWKRSFSNP